MSGTGKADPAGAHWLSPDSLSRDAGGPAIVVTAIALLIWPEIVAVEAVNVFFCALAPAGNIVQAFPWESVTDDANGRAAVAANATVAPDTIRPLLLTVTQSGPAE